MPSSASTMLTSGQPWCQAIGRPEARWLVLVIAPICTVISGRKLSSPWMSAESEFARETS